LSEALERHVIDAWFPRCLNTESGGFLSDFNRRWRDRDTGQRMLEFQARQTRVCARLAMAFPEDARWQDWALHGLRFLRDRMWDRERGGWYWMVAPDGQPLAGATKHAHSGAYAVQTAALVFQATRERWALEHAEEAFHWYDRNAYDREFGGFHGWLTREGALISDRKLVPPGLEAIDPLGHDLGLKDVNVQGDWFETLFDLAENSELARVRELRDEIGALYVDRMTNEAGEVYYAFHRDWMPQPGPEWYGYGFEATHRFLSGAQLIPSMGRMEARAAQAMRHTLAVAGLPGGGFAYAGPAGRPLNLEGHRLRSRARVWWVQFEAIRCLALYAARESEPGPQFRRLREHWAFVRRHLLDDRHGGVFPRTRHGLRPWARADVPRQGWAFAKGHNWKDASHETGSLLMAIAALRGEPVVR